jgi:hypothetical protein
MAGRRVQLVTGVVEAEPAAVWQALLATVEPDMSAAGAVIHADAERRVLSVSGHWWFRGEYAVSPDERGSLVTYGMFNVAPPLSRWLVPLVAGGALHASARPMIERQLAAIASRLGTTSHLTG